MTLRLHISSHNDDLHNSTAKRNLSGGVAGIESNGKINGEQLATHLLTVAEFRNNSGTGTSSLPANINDNNVNNVNSFSPIGEYTEVLFDDYATITEFRHYFSTAGGNSDGEYKIQYLWGGVWIDNTSNIIVIIQSAWSSWTKLSFPIITKGIRIVATKVDTSLAILGLSELQLRG